jgi:RNA polymerase sigma-70 factor, ECF subfamily
MQAFFCIFTSTDLGASFGQSERLLPVTSQAPLMSSSPLPTAGSLWQTFHDELYGFVRARVSSESVSEDLLQAAFLRAHQALQTGRGPEEPRAWLFQIVRNLLRDSYRQKKRASDLQDQLRAHLDTEAGTPEEERATFEMVARLLPNFIDALESPYRRALQLTDLEGLTQAEAAKEEGVTLACMKARVRRGREQLLASLKQCCDFERDGRGRMMECIPRSPGSACSTCK